MPISKSAKKSLRSSLAKHTRNVVIKTNLKKTIKEASEENLPKVFSVIDKAAKRHIIHKNKAARIKSRLAKRFSGKTDQELKTEVKKQTSRSKTKKARKTSKKKTKKSSMKKKK